MIGPDEYHETIDDNAFTNVMARWNIRRGLAVAALLRKKWPERWASLSGGIGLDDAELRQWASVSDTMATGFDRHTGLFEQFAGVTMSENCIGREIIRCIHKVSLRSCCLASPTNARLRIADNSVFKIDQSCLKQWSQTEDDGRCIASRIGHKARVSNRVPMQFRTTVDGLGLQYRCGLRICIL